MDILTSHIDHSVEQHIFKTFDPTPAMFCRLVEDPVIHLKFIKGIILQFQHTIIREKTGKIIKHASVVVH